MKLNIMEWTKNSLTQDQKVRSSKIHAKLDECLCLVDICLKQPLFLISHEP